MSLSRLLLQHYSLVFFPSLSFFFCAFPALNRAKLLLLFLLADWLTGWHITRLIRSLDIGDAEKRGEMRGRLFDCADLPSPLLQNAGNSLSAAHSPSHLLLLLLFLAFSARKKAASFSLSPSLLTSAALAFSSSSSSFLLFLLLHQNPRLLFDSLFLPLWVHCCWCCCCFSNGSKTVPYFEMNEGAVVRALVVLI